MPRGGTYRRRNAVERAVFWHAILEGVIPEGALHVSRADARLLHPVVGWRRLTFTLPSVQAPGL